MSRTWNRAPQRSRPATRTSRKRSSLKLGSPPPIRRQRSSLAVAGQHLLTRIADLAAVGLQAAEDGEHVVLAVFPEELLAIADHVRMAGDAFLIGALRD